MDLFQFYQLRLGQELFVAHGTAIIKAQKFIAAIQSLLHHF
jgi:hypothetical protein